jgi:hypothetical protein
LQSFSTSSALLLQKHIKSTGLNNFKVINKNNIIFQYPLCMGWFLPNPPVSIIVKPYISITLYIKCISIPSVHEWLLQSIYIQWFINRNLTVYRQKIITLPTDVLSTHELTVINRVYNNKLYDVLFCQITCQT